MEVYLAVSMYLVSMMVGNGFIGLLETITLSKGLRSLLMRLDCYLKIILKI